MLSHYSTDKAFYSSSLKLLTLQGLDLLLENADLRWRRLVLFLLLLDPLVGGVVVDVTQRTPRALSYSFRSWS